ncbi:MAG: hypothetical protein IRZ20_09115 [Thermoleophilia bacterium]|nr:hypothetical protein [Thermoleophilia bacterium]
MRIVGVVDEARAVLRRMERIEALEREGAPPELLLAELRELAREAADWARLEGDPAAQAAAAACARALAAPQATPVS